MNDKQVSERKNLVVQAEHCTHGWMGGYVDGQKEKRERNARIKKVRCLQVSPSGMCIPSPAETNLGYL